LQPAALPPATPPRRFYKRSPLWLTAIYTSYCHHRPV